MSRYSTSDEPNFDIPKPIEFIDSISLDEELQLIREQFLEEMAPIDAAWAAYEPRASWSPPRPMQIFRPEAHWHLTGLQTEYLKHIVYEGEIGLHEAVGLVHRRGFRSALDMLQERYGNTSMRLIIEAADLMSELRAGAV